MAQVVPQPPGGKQEAGGPGQTAAACQSGPLISYGSPLVGVSSSGVVIAMGPCWASQYRTPNPGWEADYDRGHYREALPAHSSLHTWLQGWYFSPKSTGMPFGVVSAYLR